MPFFACWWDRWKQPGQLPTGTGPTVDSAAAAEQEVEHALLSNNADAVGRLLADDWIVVSTYGGVGDRDGFLEVIRNGSFSRKTM